MLDASLLIVYSGGDRDVLVFLLLVVEPKGWANGEVMLGMLYSGS